MLLYGNSLVSGIYKEAERFWVRGPWWWWCFHWGCQNIECHVLKFIHVSRNYAVFFPLVLRFFHRYYQDCWYSKTFPLIVRVKLQATQPKTGHNWAGIDLWDSLAVGMSNSSIWSFRYPICNTTLLGPLNDRGQLGDPL